MKKIVLIALSFVVILSAMFGCSKSEDKINSKITKNVNEYFEFYEKADYQKIKSYCSKNFIKEYFHTDDVFGNKTAKLGKINSINYNEDEQSYIVTVDVSVTPTKSSALYDENENLVDTSFSLIIKENINNEYIIDGITTE